MKVSWQWLKEYVDVDSVTPRELARRLTMAGLEAEKIEEIGADWDRDLIRVAQVKEVRKIEGADRVVQAILTLPERDVMVVTGAPNIAVGQKIALGLIGARLYDGHRDDGVLRTLKSRPIMGITGEGMVCSEKELGLSNEHEGILVLPDDAPIGEPLVDYLGDTVIEFEITPNLVHDFSVIGVAREAGALLRSAFRDPFPVWATAPLSAQQLPDLITVEAPDLCPRYTAIVVTGVTVEPSPDWMQRRLNAVGIRPVNNIVDISNYVMIEYGQPNHTFDLDRLVGGRLIVRRAHPGEILELINHETRTLTSDMAAVCDEAGVTDLGGIIGGTRSEIVETTKNVLIEAANWEMRNVRHTRQALNLRTDASARYERGLEPELTLPTARRVASLITSLCPNARVAGWTDIYPAPRPQRMVEMRYSKIEAVLGATYPLSDVIDVLTRLQFGITVSDGADPRLTIAIPAHRSDVSRPEDIIEEVARIVGYETIPTTLIDGQVPHVIRTDRLIAREAAKDALASAGIVEVVTYSFTSEDALDRLAIVGGPAGRDVPVVRLVNPMGDWEAMRPTLRASLLSTAADNLKFTPSVAIGEVANIYIPRGGDELPDERLTMTMVLTGVDGARSLEFEPRPYDFFDLKGTIEAILPVLGIGHARFAPSEDPVFQPGRAAEITNGDIKLGVIGEVHPTVVSAFNLQGRVLLAELDLEPIIAIVASHRGALRQLPAVSRFPATENDFAIVVDEQTPAGNVADVLAQAIGTLGKGVRLFDVYHGEQVPAGKKSLTFTVILQAPDRALTDAETAKVRDRVAQALTKRLKATLRS